MVSAPPLIWFRPSIRRRVLRAWVVAVILIIIGGAILGALRSERVDFGSPWLGAYVPGIGLVIAGPTWLAINLGRLMRDERVLSCHADGLRWRDQHQTVHVPWDAMRDVVDSPDALVITHAAGAELRWHEPFEDVSFAEIAKTVRELRQKALLGLTVRLRESRTALD